MMVAPLRANGEAIPLAHDYDGIALNRARRWKETTYPELLARNGRVRLVVLAIETGGRWRTEDIEFIRMFFFCRNVCIFFAYENLDKLGSNLT